MNDVDAAIRLAQFEEHIRQQRETFEQRKVQDRRWSLLRLSMGTIAAVLLPAICVVATYIALNPESYSDATVTVATSALLADVLGLLATVWRLVLGTGPTTLEPVTTPPPDLVSDLL
jgi:hypothetical protein